MTGVVAQALQQAVSCAGHAYIGGQWVPVCGTERLAVINPANGTLVTEIVAGNSADLDRAVSAARAAFPAFAASLVADRLALLERIHALILERAEPLAQALMLEMGAAITHARSAHVPFAAAHVQAAIDVLRDYDFLTMRGTTAIVREP
ncbi:MAG: aldehyde dehydrogenase family protein, partial [Novosphingobium sp.]|nr:aldehyde dehydrogenase family protein [Novosphingobium sp.]